MKRPPATTVTDSQCCCDSFYEAVIPDVCFHLFRFFRWLEEGLHHRPQAEAECKETSAHSPSVCFSVGVELLCRDLWGPFSGLCPGAHITTKYFLTHDDDDDDADDG